LFACTQFFVIFALFWLCVSCQVDDSKTPDQAPRNGLNPGEAAARTAEPKQRGPVSSFVTEECILERVDSPRAEGDNTSALEIAAASGWVLSSVLLSDPKSATYSRNSLPIDETGLYTFDASFGGSNDGKQCWGAVEVATTDQDVNVKVRMP
jgi:hypothetical protein